MQELTTGWESAAYFVPDPDTGEFKDLQQRKDDQQGQPMQKPELAGGGGWFSGGGGTNP